MKTIECVSEQSIGSSGSNFESLREVNVMTRMVVGIACAALSVALLFYAVWQATGGTSGMPSLGAALVLLLVAVATLRPRRLSR